MKKVFGLLLVAVALVATLAFAFGIGTAPVAQAQQSGAATQLFNQTISVTDTAYSPSFPVGIYDAAELQYSLVFSAGEVNTTTVTLQYSNDGVHWIDSELVETSETVNAISEKDVTGALWRVKVETTNDQDPADVYVGAVLKEVARANVTIDSITVLTATVP